MKKLKLITSLLILTLIIALNSIGAISEWKNDITGWWYAEGHSWKVGQILIDKIPYYFHSDGYMIKDKTIDGYNPNSSEAGTNGTSASKETSGLDYIGQKILDNISAENPSFDLDYKGDINSAGKAIEDKIDNLKYTNPYEAYNISSYNIQASSPLGSSNVRVRVNCVYKMTAEMEAELDAKARAIVARIAPGSMGQSKKELAIHDWIVNNTRYDQSYKIYDPYNTLIKHTGVCEGYCLLAQKMFTIAGIKSIVVEGTAKGQAHSWNMVYIDNKWRNVDVTWDDPVSSKDILRYDYFNITDSKLSADHTWDTSKYPSANG
ncbi:cell wall-binding protein [Clostridium beijerinckii]|nr:cell wall-binding protein [Clostridium beijerinckii]